MILLFYRFSSFSLLYSRFLKDNIQTSVLNFFEKQKELVTVEVEQSRGTVPPSIPSLEESENMKSLIFHIAKNCPGVQNLKFWESRWKDGNLESKSWLKTMNPIEVPNLYSQLSKIDRLSFDPCVERSSLSLRLDYWESYPGYCTDYLSRKFLQSHTFIEHLTLIFEVADSMLQTIFQFMVSCWLTLVN